MHLVCLTHLFYPAHGGTERALLDLAREMVNRGHRVSIVTSNQTALEDFRSPRFHSELAAEETREGIRIHRLPLSAGQRLILARAGALCLRSGLPGGATLWFMTQVPHLPQMIRQARSLAPDIIYAVPFPTATPFYAWRAAASAGCPWVIQPHIHEAQINGSLLKVMKWLFPKASAILTNTEPEKRFLVSRGLDPSTIRVFGQGLPPSAWDPGDGPAFRRLLGLAGEPLVVFLGRKVEGKGLEPLLEAMPQIWSKTPDAVLLLAGQPSPFSRTLMAENPTARDPRVRSIDNFPETQKKDLLAAGDLLVLPSSIESFGVVFLEAWAQGKPVIGADIPAVAAMIEDGRDGLVIPVDDAGSLAQAILRLIQDPGMRRSLGEAGAVKVRDHFETGKVAARMEAFFLELIEESKRAGGRGKRGVGRRG